MLPLLLNPVAPDWQSPSHFGDAESCCWSAVSLWERRDREAAWPRPHRKLLAIQWAEPVCQVPEQQSHHRITFPLHTIPRTIQIFKAKAYVQTWKLFKLLNATNVYQTRNSLLVQITSVKSGSYSSAPESLISSFSKIKETPTHSRCFCKSLEGENAAQGRDNEPSFLPQQQQIPAVSPSPNRKALFIKLGHIPHVSTRFSTSGYSMKRGGFRLTNFQSPNLRDHFKSEKSFWKGSAVSPVLVRFGHSVHYRVTSQPELDPYLLLGSLQQAEVLKQLHYFLHIR